MKEINRLLVAAAAVITFSTTLSAHAGEPLHSPRAKAFADSLKNVPALSSGVIDRSVKSGSPKGIALAESLRRVPRTGPGLNLAQAPRPSFSPKDPRYETALRENAASQLSIAVVK